MINFLVAGEPNVMPASLLPGDVLIGVERTAIGCKASVQFAWPQAEAPGDPVVIGRWRLYSSTDGIPFRLELEYSDVTDIDINNLVEIVGHDFAVEIRRRIRTLKFRLSPQDQRRFEVCTIADPEHFLAAFRTAAQAAGGDPLTATSIMAPQWDLQFRLAAQCGGDISRRRQAWDAVMRVPA